MLEFDKNFCDKKFKIIYKTPQKKSNLNMTENLGNRNDWSEVCKPL